MKDTDLNYLDSFSSAFVDKFKELLKVHARCKEVLSRQQVSAPGEECEFADDAHNQFLDYIQNVYLSKFVMCYNLIIYSVKNKNYICYALAGRSMLELVAVLDYHLVKYFENLEKNHKTPDLLFENYNKLHHEHMGSSRFNWQALVWDQRQVLREEYLDSIKNKKPKQKASVNIVTCINKIGKEEPDFGVLYSLFCELVHPNLGNTFLTLSGKGGEFGINKKGIDIGIIAMESTIEELIENTIYRLKSQQIDLNKLYTDNKKRNIYHIN